MPALPSGFVQLSTTCSSTAPAKLVDDVMARDVTSCVWTVQDPSASCVPLFKVHPEGMPVTVTVTRRPWYADGRVRPRLMGSPDTPDGASEVKSPAIKEVPFVRWISISVLPGVSRLPDALA